MNWLATCYCRVSIRNYLLAFWLVDFFYCISATKIFISDFKISKTEEPSDWLHLLCSTVILITPFRWYPPVSPTSSSSTGTSHQSFQYWSRRLRFPQPTHWYITTTLSREGPRQISSAPIWVTRSLLITTAQQLLDIRSARQCGSPHGIWNRKTMASWLPGS